MIRKQLVYNFAKNTNPIEEGDHMKEKNSVSLKDKTTVVKSENGDDLSKKLIQTASEKLVEIENILYSAPKFVDIVKSTIPKQAYEAVLTGSQKAKLATGTLKLMTKKDGTLLANLVDPKTNKIVSSIPMKSIEISEHLNETISNYTNGLQMAHIAVQIQKVQLTVKEVLEGQELDRLSTAYSCQQKLLQAMNIEDSNLRRSALLDIAHTAEDSRNMLMLSQRKNLHFIESQPETYIKKVLNGADLKTIDQKLDEIRENLCAINIASLVEAVAYRELGKIKSSQESLKYYKAYIDNTYLSDEKLIGRLDSNDSNSNYWSKALTDISDKVKLISHDEEN